MTDNTETNILEVLKEHQKTLELHQKMILDLEKALIQANVDIAELCIDMEKNHG